MALPNWTSDFTIGNQNAAWWTTGLTSPVQVCATQGMTFFKRVQRALNDAGIQAPRRGTTNNVAIAVDGDCGYQTLSGLWSAATQLDADNAGQGYNTLASTILADRDNNRVLSRSTMMFAAWFLAGQVGDWNSVVMPSNAIFPRAGVAPANDGSGSDGTSLTIACWSESAAVSVTRGPSPSSSTGLAGAPAGSSSAVTPAASASGLSGWWAARSTGEKFAVGGLAAAALWAASRKKKRGM